MLFICILGFLSLNHVFGYVCVCQAKVSVIFPFVRFVFVFFFLLLTSVKVTQVTETAISI